MSDSPKTSRRNLFLGLGGLAAVAVGWQVFGARTRVLEFSPIQGLEGWRQAQAGGITAPGGSATSAVLVGIDDEDITPLSPTGLCPALFQNREGGVPVAVFSDFFCPNCRELDARLAKRTDIAITWHQLPLLGPSSKLVAAVNATGPPDRYTL